MEVKGTSVVSVPEFVKKRFPSRYHEWIQSLPAASREIIEKNIIVSLWYPVTDTVTIPTQKICDLFFGGAIQGAWDAGKFSAEYALKGVYKLFLKIGTPGFIVSRGTSIFSTYYRPSLLRVITNEPKQVVVHIVEFHEISSIIEHRIGGWIERALEISGCKGTTVTISKSLTRKDPVTEYIVKWM